MHPLANLEKYIAYNRYITVIVPERDKRCANDIILLGITGWPTIGLLPMGAITDNGDNDTSVAFGAARGVPGGGETPMRKTRSLSSVVCPYVGD